MREKYYLLVWYILIIIIIIINYNYRIPLLIELARLCLEHSKHELAADCLENVKGGVKVTNLYIIMQRVFAC